jgi:hypothetical protein
MPAAASHVAGKRRSRSPDRLHNIARLPALLARDEAGADGSERRIELYFGPARSSFFDGWRYRIS